MLGRLYKMPMSIMWEDIRKDDFLLIIKRAQLIQGRREPTTGPVAGGHVPSPYCWDLSQNCQYCRKLSTGGGGVKIPNIVVRKIFWFVGKFFWFVGKVLPLPPPKKNMGPMAPLHGPQDKMTNWWTRAPRPTRLSRWRMATPKSIFNRNQRENRQLITCKKSPHA
jgi:hypothetical protein